MLNDEIVRGDNRVPVSSTLGLSFRTLPGNRLARKAASVAEQGPESFAELLRRLRVTAGLTQEQLADLATVSVRSVSDLERGVNLTARRETARLLADALGLRGDARAGFEAAARLGTAAWDTGARAPRPDAGIAAATRTLPR